MREELLDQAGARPARRRRLGVRAHLFQREQLLVDDRARDRPLADAVAAADFDIVAHGDDRVAATAAPRIAQMRLPEQQPIAHAGYVGAVAQQVEIPAAVDRVAVEHGAADAVAFEHELLVDAAAGVLNDDLLGPLVAEEVAGREHVDAGHLEARRGDRALVAGVAELRQVIGADLRLLEQRRHQAIGAPAALRAFADRIDARIVGLHRVVDDDAALAMQPGTARQRDIGADADRHDDQVGRNHRAVLEADRLDAGVAKNGFRLRAGAEDEAARLERSAQQARRGSIELALHQRVHQMEHGDGHPLLHQAVRGFEAQQAAADDDRVLARARRVQHRFDIGDRAEGEHARQILARDRQHDRIGTGHQQKAIVGRPRSIRRNDAAPPPVDLDDLLAFAQRDAVVGVPCLVVQHDFRERLLAGEDRREQNPVVVAVRLLAEDGDVVEVRGELQQLLHRPDAGHAVSNDDELLLHRTGHSRTAPNARQWVSRKTHATARATETASKRHRNAVRLSDC